MCEIVSNPRNNSLYAFINSVRQVACIPQGGLQLVLKVAHCMEVFYLNRQARVKINSVSWIEIVKELVKIFKAPQNHADRCRCLVGNCSFISYPVFPAFGL